MFGGRLVNRGASGAINYQQRIDKSSRKRDRIASRVMNNRDRSKGRMVTFFENVKFHREKRQF